MIGIVFLLLGAFGAAVMALIIVMFFDATRGGADRVASEREREARQWLPPFARGAELVYWASRRARGAVRRALEGEPGASTPRTIITALHDGATRAMLPRVRARDRARPVACPREGQGTIGVTGIEALALAEHLREDLSASELAAVQRRSREIAALLAKGDPAAVVPPCALQSGDCMCIAYPTRPLNCRPLHAAATADRLGLDGGVPGGRVPLWLRHAETVAAGVEQGLRSALEQAGLDGRIYELHSALACALERPDGSRRFMAGENPFAAARPLRA
ncbi:MAG: hypothetical protein R3E10_11600 [Gemmatimonadota bacterium]